MNRQFLSISALLLGSAFLLLAGGLNGLILPVRGTAEGFSAFSLGLLGTGWAIGYVSGCYFTPRLVERVGHVRSFGVMAAFAAIAILLSLLMLSPWAWIPLRALSGFCFAGAAMIVEGWLSDRVDRTSRGRVFGVYTMVNLVATTGGQLALTMGSTQGYMMFVIGAIFYCLALVPTAVSSSESPAPLVDVKIDLRLLWRNSPVAVVAVFLIGVSNSAFGALAAVYAGRLGLDLDTIAFFASLPIIAGAASQIPVGWASDRLDRRVVLVAVAGVAIAADTAFIVLAPESVTVNLALAFLFGGAIYAMYPVILAHANDHAPPGTAIQTSGGLLMLFGFGGIVGPFTAGVLMVEVGLAGLFWTSLAAHLTLVVFAALRIRARAALPTEEKGNFVVAAPVRGGTPQTAILSLPEEEVREAQ